MNEHEQKYSALQEEIRLVLPPNFLGNSTEQWRALYRNDPHLNNVKLCKWDRVAYNLLKGKGLSLAEAVCLLKYCVFAQIINSYEVKSDSIYPYVLVLQGPIDDYYYRVLKPNGEYAALSKFTKEEALRYIEAEKAIEHNLKA